MLAKIFDFMEMVGIRGSRSLGTLLDRLEEEGEDELAEEVEGAMSEYSLLASQRIDTLVLTLAGNEGEEEEGEKKKG